MHLLPSPNKAVNSFRLISQNQSPSLHLSSHSLHVGPSQALCWSGLSYNHTATIRNTSAFTLGIGSNCTQTIHNRPQQLHTPMLPSLKVTLTVRLLICGCHWLDKSNLTTTPPSQISVSTQANPVIFSMQATYLTWTDVTTISPYIQHFQTPLQKTAFPNQSSLHSQTQTPKHQTVKPILQNCKIAKPLPLLSHYSAMTHVLIQCKPKNFLCGTKSLRFDFCVSMPTFSDEVILLETCNQ